MGNPAGQIQYSEVEILKMKIEELLAERNTKTLQDAKCYYLYMKEIDTRSNEPAKHLFCLSAETIEKAREEVEYSYFNRNGEYGWGRQLDYNLVEAIIFKYEEDVMPILNDILEKIEIERRDKQQQRVEAQERAEYERLKKKFGE
ncbi:MAG: hypothetical protein WC523_03965 [Patescibacteria group bacterium]